MTKNDEEISEKPMKVMYGSHLLPVWTREQVIKEKKLAREDVLKSIYHEPIKANQCGLKEHCKKLTCLQCYDKTKQEIQKLKDEMERNGKRCDEHRKRLLDNATEFAVLEDEIKKLRDALTASNRIIESLKKLQTIPETTVDTVLENNKKALSEKEGEK